MAASCRPLLISVDKLKSIFFPPIPQPSPDQRTVVSEWPCWLQSSVASSSSPCPCPSSSAACRSDPVGTEPRRRDGAGRAGERAVISNPQLPVVKRCKTPELMRISPSQAQGEALEPSQRVLAGERRGGVGGVPSPKDLPSLAEDEPPPGSRQPPLPDRRTQRIREQGLPEVKWHRRREPNTRTPNQNRLEKRYLSLSLSVPHTGVRRVC